MFEILQIYFDKSKKQTWVRERGGGGDLKAFPRA